MRFAVQVQNYLIGVAAVIAVFWMVWQHGRVTERAVWQERVAELTAARRVQAARIIGQAEQIAQLQAERDRIARELEDEARADASADRIAVPPDSVLRINRR